MFKKIICALLTVLLLPSTVLAGGGAAYATTIGSDVSNSLPIVGAMETAEEAAAIQQQISASGSAELVLDGVKGKYAVKVTANDVTNDFTYTLVNSSVFTIADYSQVHLWVKPGLGAQWLELSTATSSVKRYTVGTDLVSGKWNEITLDLTKIAGTLTQGQNLNVKTDDASIWYFDDVSSVATMVYQVNLAEMVNAKTEIANNGLQFKDISTTCFDTTPTVLTSGQVAIDQNKKITGININSKYANTSGDLSALPSEAFYLSGITSTVFALSGDGNWLFYYNSPNVYKLNLRTGVSTQIAASLSPESMKSNYDGSVVAIWKYSLYVYKSSTGMAPLLDSVVQLYGVQDNGDIYYYESNNTVEIHYYDGSSSTTIKSGTSIADLEVPRTGNVFYYKTTGSSPTYTKFEKSTYSGWISTTVNSCGYLNEDGHKCVLVSGGYLYVYDYEKKTTEKMGDNLKVSAIYLFKDDKVIYKDSQNLSYHILDINTGEVEDITVNDLAYYSSSTYAAFSINGEKMAYLAKIGSNYGIKVKYLNDVKEPEKYLLSFDGKLSWYSYQDEQWQKVSTDASPTAVVFEQYGMTKDEINALTEADFAGLYKDNSKIYSVNVAAYMASVDAFTTPSIKSINILTNNDAGTLTNDENAATLYAAKKQDFAAANWRKVKKIYPLELAPKSADFYYYVYVSSDYKVYKDGSWQTVTDAATHLADVEANWLPISLEAMTATELRAVPEAALTSELAGKDFSIVYPLKVNDQSTANYSSKINIDYVEDLFSGTTLTLSITFYGSSTPKTYTNLTATQVEDFMEWLNGRQMNHGPVFYRINNGTTSDFINYYTIQEISVSE